MHYYQHNIGDYLGRTANLSLLEHGVYLRLLHVYYSEEKPIGGDLNRAIGARTEEEKAAVRYILETYFLPEGDLFRNPGADKRIAEFHSKSDKSRGAALKRWENERKANAQETDADAQKPDANGMQTNNSLTNNQYTNTEEVEKEKDPIPYDRIVDLYHEILPELPGVKFLTPKRKAAIRTCAKTKPRYVEEAFWRDYFTNVRASDFLMGKKADWKADFDFLTRHSRFIKVIEGAYHRE